MSVSTTNFENYTLPAPAYVDVAAEYEQIANALDGIDFRNTCLRQPRVADANQQRRADGCIPLEAPLLDARRCRIYRHDHRAAYHQRHERRKPLAGSNPNRRTNLPDEWRAQNKRG